MAFEFNNCCFCIDLRTGCLIIGYLSLVADIVEILVPIFGLITAGVISWGALNDKDMTPDAKEGVQAVGAIMFGIIVVMLVFLILSVAVTIVLLVGLHKHKRGHIKAYLIFALVFMALSIIEFFASFGGPVDAELIIKQMCNLLDIFLRIYFLLVIRSYYLKMDIYNKPAIYVTTLHSV